MIILLVGHTALTVLRYLAAALPEIVLAQFLPVVLRILGRGQRRGKEETSSTEVGTHLGVAAVKDHNNNLNPPQPEFFELKGMRRYPKIEHMQSALESGSLNEDQDQDFHQELKADPSHPPAQNNTTPTLPPVPASPHKSDVEEEHVAASNATSVS